MHHIHLSTVDSTNTWIKNHVDLLDPHLITCVTADTQTAGRGRGGNRWISPSKKNLYASFYFFRPTNYPVLSHLAQIGSLACVRALETLRLTPELKWPNDVLINGKKIAGILVETLSLKEGIGIILGIGLNVNMESGDFPKELPITSILEELHQVQKIPHVLDLFEKAFLTELNTLEKEGFNPFLPLYQKLLIYRQGDLLSCLQGTTPLVGTFMGIDEEGRLRLKLPSEEILTLSSGEVSLVRKK